MQCDVTWYVNVRYDARLIYVKLLLVYDIEKTREKIVYILLKACVKSWQLEELKSTTSDPLLYVYLFFWRTKLYSCMLG